VLTAYLNLYPGFKAGCFFQQYADKIESLSGIRNKIQWAKATAAMDSFLANGLGHA